jgi:hypothetical protein
VRVITSRFSADIVAVYQSSPDAKVSEYRRYLNFIPEWLEFLIRINEAIFRDEGWEVILPNEPTGAA